MPLIFLQGWRKKASSAISAVHLSSIATADDLTRKKNVDDVVAIYLRQIKSKNLSKLRGVTAFPAIKYRQ